jgi:hypothetical protein
VTGQQLRDRLLLDRCWFLVAELVERELELRLEAEVSKGRH